MSELSFILMGINTSSLVVESSFVLFVEFVVIIKINCKRSKERGAKFQWMREKFLIVMSTIQRLKAP